MLLLTSPLFVTIATIPGSLTTNPRTVSKPLHLCRHREVVRVKGRTLRWLKSKLASTVSKYLGMTRLSYRQKSKRSYAPTGTRGGRYVDDTASNL